MLVVFAPGAIAGTGTAPFRSFLTYLTTCHLLHLARPSNTEACGFIPGAAPMMQALALRPSAHTGGASSMTALTASRRSPFAALLLNDSPAVCSAKSEGSFTSVTTCHLLHLARPSKTEACWFTPGVTPI
jgi:hypothetical protein